MFHGPGSHSCSVRECTLTSWRMRTSEPELRTPAFTPVGHDVTLAVMRVSASVFGLAAALGIWGPSPGNPSVGSKPPSPRAWAGLHRRQARAWWGATPWATSCVQLGSHPPGPAGWSAAKARAWSSGIPTALVPAARVATVRAANARAGHQALAATGLCGLAGPPGLGSARDSGEEGVGVAIPWRGGWPTPLTLRIPRCATPGNPGR